ncbi:hypothetical protein, partial [Bacillus cereus]|uniref:hypothetical protein n=1 Tax=Bacillus cereus TaxID=1396 RepID=UPI000C01262D
LYYQTQSINRFSTPIQYFPINALKLPTIRDQFICLENYSVIFSSMEVTLDQSGIELRLYNPLDVPQDNPGVIQLQENAEVKLLDLKGKIIEHISSHAKRLNMEAFRAGEIRTYGIFFKE